MKALFFILTISLFFLVGTQDALGCSCAAPRSDSEEVQVNDAKENADAVFVGKLIKLVEPKNADGKPTGDVIAEFEVERAWTDMPTSRVKVHTTNICCICGFPFRKGMRYIVYASGKDRLSTNICTRTALLLEEGSPDERYLGVPVIFEKGKKII